MSLQGAWARSVIEGLRAGGVSSFVACPGSRSTPLAIAAWPWLDGDAIVDERSAGFYALGQGLRGRPTAVITTSGSAVANLLPAAVEAHQADVPLVLLTADRPPALRGTGSNQTIAQPGLFGVHARAAMDLPLAGDPQRACDAARGLAEAAVHGAPPGPAHLNVPLAKPLEPDAQDLAALTAPDASTPSVRPDPEAAPTRPDPEAAPTHPGPGHAAPMHADPQDAVDALRRWFPGGRGVIVVGPQRDPALGDAVRAVAHALDAPIIADGLSQVRFQDPEGTVLVGAHDAILADPMARDALRPDWILNVGGLPVSHHLAMWIQAHAVPRARIDATRRGWDGLGSPCTIVPGDPALVLRAWHAGLGPRGDAGPRGDTSGRREHPSWSASWARLEDAAWDATPLDDSEARIPEMVLDMDGPVFVGNSLPVRDLDRLARPRPRGPVLGSRGASGIDGLIATTAGVGGVGVIGDMAFRHDVGSLGLLHRGGRLVVVDNGGGRIFDRLPVRDARLPDGAYERLFRAPGRLDMVSAARAAGLTAEWVDPAGLARIVREGREGPQVVVVETDGDAGHAWRARHLEGVRKAVRPLLPERPTAQPS